MKLNVKTFRALILMASLIGGTAYCYFRRVNLAIVVLDTAGGVLGDKSNQISHAVTST